MHSIDDKTAQSTQRAATAPHNGAGAESAGCVAGVDIGGTNLRLALADMSGNIQARWSGTTAGVRGPDAVIRLIRDGLRTTRQHIGAAPESLRAIGVGVPGVTDIESGVVLATSYLMGWRDVPLRALLEAELGVPAAVDNDVNLAAIGEAWAGAAKGARDFVFLAIGTGVGAGIILNGSPYRGSNWSAGEVGYMLLPGTINGPGDSDGAGALEGMIGGQGIRAQWQKRWAPDRTALSRESTATEIFDGALSGDALAQTILQQSATMLAQAIYNISLVLDCPLFVLGGAVGSHPALRESAERELANWHVRGRPRLACSALGTGAQLQGALRAALDAAGSQAGIASR